VVQLLLLLLVEISQIKDNEIPLGELITVNDINSELGDNKISTLFDGEIKWDDGEDSKRYDLHEVISISDGMKTQTTLDNNEFETSAVLENNQALTYKLIFDDSLSDLDLIGTDDADELYLTILGKEYEVLEMDPNSITVSLAEQITVEAGGTFIVDGITLTVEDIYDDTVQINGKLIREEGTKTVDGIKVYVENIGYHSVAGYTNKVILKVGKDIEKEFEDGDEYFEDDETWEWTIKDPGEVGGHIGVKYVRNSVGYDEDEDEDNAVGIGGSYVFPENYAAVLFNGLSDVDYENFELSFDDKKLYTGIDNSGISTDVAILQGENDESFELDNGWETDSLYFKYTEDGVELYFKDINGDVDPDKEGRIQLYEYVIDDETTVPAFPVYEGEEIVGYTYYVRETLTIVPDVDKVNPTLDETITGYEYEVNPGEFVPAFKVGEDEYEYEVTTNSGTGDISYKDIATLIVDDTEVNLGLNLTSEKKKFRIEFNFWKESWFKIN